MSRTKSILGISAFYHDSAACLVQDGRIVAAAQEERFTRKKHDAAFPKHAVQYCLEAGGIGIGEVDVVAFYEKPFLKFDRILHSYLACAPRGFRSFLMSIPLWIRERIWMKELIRKELYGDDPHSLKLRRTGAEVVSNGGNRNGLPTDGALGPPSRNSYGATRQGAPPTEPKILFPEHHESHAASAFFPSPFQDAAILTIDGVGEWTTTSFGEGHGNAVQLHSELHFPHSLGLLYSAFTYYTGFKVNSGEYKLMGLAPYGEPKYVDTILRELIDLKQDGSFRLNMEYFDYAVGLRMTNERFHRLFGGPPRQPESRMTQRDMDLARSVQEVTGEAMFRMARHVAKQTGLKNLCLAGGVALNCVANGRILREGLFDRLWIQPAAGDAGGALGAALSAWYSYGQNPRKADGVHDAQCGSLLGPEFSSDHIRRFLLERGVAFTEVSENDLPEKVADLIAAEKVVGWFQGRMEFGPRALGARSILGDARSPRMQQMMNLKIKFRESFRPFAPSVLRERAPEYFDLHEDSPYMLLVAPVAQRQRRTLTPAEQSRFGIEKLLTIRSSIPAVTHVDHSARVQTVTEAENPVYYRLLKAMAERHGCPVIINTSFNVRGEPIVCTPEDAWRCFGRTNMDYLVVGNFLLEKTESQPLDKDLNWLKEFELD